MNRRNLLLTGSAAAIGALTPVRLPAFVAEPVTGPEDAKLRDILDRMYAFQLDLSPEGVTDLGLDKGDRASARSWLDDRSRAGDRAFLAAQSGYQRELEAIDASKLGAAAKIHRDTMLTHLDVALGGARRFGFGLRSDPAPFMLTQLSGVHPYVLSHLDGSYAGIPDFMVGKHAVASAADADAYVARMNGFAAALDQETMRAGEDARRGVMPPDFILDKALAQLKALRDTPARQTTLVRNLAERVRAAALPDAFVARAQRTVERKIAPALDRQIAFLTGLRGRATADAGVWRLPDGDDYYAYATRCNTTLDIAPPEIHRLGLEQVAEISGRIDGLLKAQGYAIGPVGSRLAALAAEPRFSFPNDETGKAAIIALFRSRTAAIEKQLPAYFGTLPKTELRIEPVPGELEASAPRGYYQPGSLGGGRPGTYYANMRSTAEWSRFYLPTFAFHEGVPGHHLQYSLARESGDAPSILKLLNLPGYSEGWALYAEQLADEMGLYEQDPIGRIGYLQSLLFRAVRLVVDSGIHHGRWSRERAVRYMVEAIGDPESRCISEVERYVVWPGQACSYKLGHTKWVELRRRAQAALGDRFDIKAFHDAALRGGAMPFPALERAMRT